MKEGSRPAAGQNDLSILAAASHDLKTPLAFIRGAASELKSTPVDSAQNQAQIARIEQSAGRMLSLIDSIIGTAHSQQTQLPLEPVHIGDVVWTAVNDISPYANQLGFEFQVDFPRTLPPVLTNRLALRRIVFNLIDNAIKYTQDKYEVRISAHRDRGSVRLNVRDYGVGLHRRDLDQIFNLFGTSAQPTQALAGSSGLGLFIARELSTAIHADIGAKPLLKGSNFFVRLPVARQLSLFV